MFSQVAEFASVHEPYV